MIGDNATQPTVVRAKAPPLLTLALLLWFHTPQAEISGRHAGADADADDRQARIGLVVMVMVMPPGTGIRTVAQQRQRRGHNHRNTKPALHYRPLPIFGNAICEAIGTQSRDHNCRTAVFLHMVLKWMVLNWIDLKWTVEKPSTRRGKTGDVSWCHHDKKGCPCGQPFHCQTAVRRTLA